MTFIYNCFSGKNKDIDNDDKDLKILNELSKRSAKKRKNTPANNKVRVTNGNVEIEMDDEETEDEGETEDEEQTEDEEEAEDEEETEDDSDGPDEIIIEKIKPGII